MTVYAVFIISFLLIVGFVVNFYMVGTRIADLAGGFFSVYDELQKKKDLVEIQRKEIARQSENVEGLKNALLQYQVVINTQREQVARLLQELEVSKEQRTVLTVEEKNRVN